MKINRRKNTGGAEFGIAMIIAIMVFHIALIPLVIMRMRSVTVRPGQAVTLPAVATSPPINGATSPIGIAAMAAPADIQAASEITDAPALIMMPASPGRLLLIATRYGVVQRDAGDGWEFFGAVNRVPWYWDLENTGETCVMFRLVDAD